MDPIPDLRVAVAQPGGEAARCSFCDRTADQIAVLVEGLREARICDNCAELVVEMADDEKARSPRIGRGPA